LIYDETKLQTYIDNALKVFDIIFLPERIKFNILILRYAANGKRPG
jgi:hypothetical protein